MPQPDGRAVGCPVGVPVSLEVGCWLGAGVTDARHSHLVFLFATKRHKPWQSFGLSINPTSVHVQKLLGPVGFTLPRSKQIFAFPLADESISPNGAAKS